MASNHQAHSPPSRKADIPVGPSWLAILLVAALVGASHTTPAAETSSPISVSLTDQWEKPAVLRAPLDRVTILTIADRTGAAQINGWVAPLKVKFGTNVQFFAVADVDAVPGPLRGMVRRRFAKEYSFPIGLDWKGSVTGQLRLTSESVNLFVLDRSGIVQHATHGAVGTATLRDLSDAVARLLPPANNSEPRERIATRASAP